MRFFTRLSVLLVLLISLLSIPAYAVGTEAPADPYVTGGYFFTGSDPSFGSGTIYVSDPEGWCYKDGYLFRCAASSASGVLVSSSGTVYTFSASSFSLPRYRANSSNYTYTDLYWTVTNTNVQIQENFQSYFSFDDMVSLIIIFELGLLAVIMMTRR